VKKKYKKTLDCDYIYKTCFLTFVPAMSFYCRTKATISQIICNEDSVLYRCKETNDWSWHENWLRGDKKITLKEFMENTNG
jgi:hypothetical protein